MPDSVLHTRQVLFSRSLPRLLDYAASRGYELTLGEAFVQNPRRGRDGIFREDGTHMPDSLHYLRLAIDFNLFVQEDGDWRYITRSDHWAYVDLGNYWKALDPLCAWGGDFQSGDANHFSVQYQGRR